MIYALLYVVCMGFSTVLLEKAGLSFSPALTLVFGSLIALVYFNGINFRYLGQMYRACYLHKGTILLLNLYVFVIWLSSVYGAVYAGASLFSFLFFASLGASSRFFEYIQHKKAVELLSLVLIIALLLVAIYLNVQHQLTGQIGKGIVCGVGGGVVGYFYLKLSGSFMKACNFKATQILAVRFYLAALLGCFFIPTDAISHLTLTNFGLIVLIIVTNLMVPLYFSQRSVQTIGSELTSSIISCLPLAAGVIELLMVGTVPDYNFVIYFIYALLVGLPYAYAAYKKNKATS